jgi:hypothetical protein
MYKVILLLKDLAVPFYRITIQLQDDRIVQGIREYAKQQH